MSSAEQAREVDRNYDFFMRTLSEHLVEHRDQFALIRNQTIVDFYDKPGDAYRDALSRFDDRIFSIQEVTDEPIDLGFFSHVAH